MAKNIVIIVVVLMAIFLVISTNFGFDKNDIKKNNSFQSEERINFQTIKDKSTKDKLPEDNENNAKLKENETNYVSFAKCGTDVSIYLKKMERLNDIFLTESQIDHVSKEMDMCENWFEKLELMGPENAQSLIKKLKKEKELIVSLSTLKLDLNTLEKANTAIKSKDPYVASLALNYLLQFDTEFSKKVADEMRVQNVNFLTSSDSFVFLYQCRHGMDCSPNSEMMQSACQVNPDTCGMSYESTLRNQITINQYSDMLHAINVIDLIINSDWFEQRQVLNPTDP